MRFQRFSKHNITANSILIRFTQPIIPIRLRPIGTIHLHNPLVTISINLKNFKRFIYSKSSLNQTHHLGPIRFSTTTNHLKDHNLPLSRHQGDQSDSIVDPIKETDSAVGSTIQLQSTYEALRDHPIVTRSINVKLLDEVWIKDDENLKQLLVLILDDITKDKNDKSLRLSDLSGFYTFEMFIEQRSEFIIALRAVSSIKSFLRIILCLRLDSFSKSLIDHLVDQENSTIFDIDQRIIYLQSLIDLSRTRRSILNQRLLGKKLFELITSDKSVCRYFKKLIELTGCSEKHGLDQESIRYVIRCMRRSSDQSVWNLDLIEELWNQCFLDEISKDNHRTEVYSRLSEGLIIHLIKNHSVNSNGSPNIKSVVSTCLRIWSKLLELGQISLEDFSTEFKTFHSTSTQSPQDLEPTDRVIYKVLTSIVRSSHSQLKSFSTRKQSNYHILKDSSEALEALIDRFGYSSSASEQIENLVRDHLKIYFSRVLEEVEDRRFPTREMMEVIFKFTNLSSVTGRWSTSGISRDDYSIFQEALESLFRLGKSRMLLECWLKLLPIININRTGWSLSKLLKSLEELSNPLIVGGSDAKKVMNPFKFARLVLKLFESLDSSYSQDGTSYGTKKDRFDGFRMIFERKELYEFDWIRREEKRFDREGFLIEDDEKDQVEDFKERRVEKLVERNLDIIINLWNFSWGITGVGPFKTLERDREGEDDVLLPVSVLIGVTRLTDSIKNQKAQKFLKLVINKFIFDRTFYPKAKLLTKKPSKDQPQQLHQILQHTTNKHKEEIRVYDGLFKPSLRLSDLERSSLISSHLTILRLDQQRGDFSLSEKFVKELFESYLEEKVVISAEDLVLMREFIDCTSN